MKGQGIITSPGSFQSIAIGGIQAMGPMGGGMCGMSMYGPAQAMGGKGGPQTTGSMGSMGMQHFGPPTMGGQLGCGHQTMGGFGAQAMMGSVAMQPSGWAHQPMGGQPSWGQQPLSSMGSHGHAPLGGFNGNMPLHATGQGPRPGKQQQYMANKRPAGGCGGHGSGMKRKFATQCSTYNQIPVHLKVEVLQRVYPEVWSPVTSASKTMTDIDSCLAIGFDRWPSSQVETREVTGLACAWT